MGVVSVFKLVKASKNFIFCFSVNFWEIQNIVLLFQDVNCNKIIGPGYNQQTTQALSELNEKETSFEVIEVRSLFGTFSVSRIYGYSTLLDIYTY